MTQLNHSWGGARPCASREIRTSPGQVAPAQRETQLHILRRLRRLRELRRDHSDLTGGSALAALCKTSPEDITDSSATTRGPHETIRGVDLVEPSQPRGFSILEQLPPYERELYSKEENVIERSGKCHAEYVEIVKRFSH